MVLMVGIDEVSGGVGDGVDWWWCLYGTNNGGSKCREQQYSDGDQHINILLVLCVGRQVGAGVVGAKDIKDYIKRSSNKRAETKVCRGQSCKVIMKDDRSNNQSGPLRVAVVGASEVGKSALTVRYLTKRFIGEYRSDTDMLYRCVLQVDGAPQPVEIMDTSASCQAASHAHLQWAEAFVVVYAINNKQSYSQAANTLQELNERRPSASVLVLGNKSDLGHLREVEEVEARTLALNHSARFSELSTAESCAPVSDVLNSFLKDVKSQRNGNQNNSPKLRKISVTKMLGSLIGRSSPPPTPVTHLIILDKDERNKLQTPLRRLCRPCLRPAHSLPCSPHTAV
ncbi:hypothetical protein Pmani_037014 [Petrolisthes manimaculis]|uniref:small monomeric GTPase n=1 Tax=Petrolisthes manimaculis TaxID=1843537 RepID=A0AAE1NJA9_9EUCA|nr:hypothetical protein Pmani_037014 [Petrolisthes manimaculis]